MKIKFDLEVISEEAATGIVAMLHRIFGDEVLPVPAVTNIAGNSGIVHQIDLSGNASSKTAAEAMGDAPAPDGAVADAATVFGQTEPTAAAVFGNPALAHGTAPATPPLADGVERDVDGIPWDKRIHASTKTKTQGGNWTKFRGVDAGLYASVMAELKAANTARTVQAAAAIPAAAIPAAATAGAVPTPPPSTAPTPPSTAPTPPADGKLAEILAMPPASNFPELMRKATMAQGAHLITSTDFLAILATKGMTSVIELNKNPDSIPDVEAELLTHILGG